MLCARAGVGGGIFCLTPAAHAVTMDWTFIGNPGNANNNTGFGAVGYSYSIGTYEVTYGQYAEFLNAKAKSDPLGLYNGNMGVAMTRSGVSGSFTYTVAAGSVNSPINHAGANIFLTSENEWYKAAYYSAIGTYYDYPAGTDGHDLQHADGDAEPCKLRLRQSHRSHGARQLHRLGEPVRHVRSGGNVFEWNESLSGTNRVYRGGGYDSGASFNGAATRSAFPGNFELGDIGFRLVLIPEPDTGALIAFGLIALARRRRAG